VVLLGTITSALMVGDLGIAAVAGTAAGLWVGLGVVAFVVQRWRVAPTGKRFTLEMLGMVIAHAGVAIFVSGVLITGASSIEKDVRLAPGESVAVGDLSFRFEGIEHTEGPNFKADQGSILVSRNDREIQTLHPQKRQYGVNTQVQTQAAIRAGVFRDIYVALGEPLGDNGAWAVRIYVKPLVRWIWLGGLLMMLGGFVAALDRRFRARSSERAQVAAEVLDGRP
ncbi:MAG: cytochrome c-type biogenesis CcmF C-terminal domain-containing protein, partial [Dokdonella sp.]